MLPPLFLVKAADPPGPGVVVPVPPEHAVHLIDELQCQSHEFFAPCFPIKTEKIAHRESIGP
jgi:hypothetical protein